MADKFGFKPTYGYPPNPHPSTTYPPGSYPPPPTSSMPHHSPYPNNSYLSPPNEHHSDFPRRSYPSHSPPSYLPPMHEQAKVFRGPARYPQNQHHGHATADNAYYWADWNTRRMLPPTAVRGGTDSDGCSIYVGRAFHAGDWIPAKVIPEKDVAYVAHAGREHAKDNFQILCEQRFEWISTSGDNIPPNAIEGGKTSSGEILYIGRVFYHGAQTVGKVQPSHRTCYIPYGGEEIAFPQYEILVLRN